MKISKWPEKYSLLLIIIFSIISRLPQILSGNLMLDGDECIVGLMAKHFSEGKTIPWFFYGQSYGFTLIEVFAIRVFYVFFNISDLAVKLSMFFLWLLGICFFYKSLKSIDNSKNSFLALFLTLVFVLFPSWAIWSMKARGGYTTSFLLSSVIIYLMFNRKWNNSIIALFLIGFLSVIIFQSQPLWLPGLIPIVLYYLYQNRSIKSFIYIVSGVLICSFIFLIIKSDISYYWAPKVIGSYTPNINSLLIAFKLVYYNFLGNYTYNDFNEAPFITKIIAASNLFLMFATLIIGLIYFLRKKEINPLFYVLCFSVLFTISYTVFISNSPRYLLPLSGFVFYMYYFLFNLIKNKKWVYIVLFLFLILGFYSMNMFKNYKFEDKAELVSFIKTLESKNISHVYCEDGLLQWQIMFYSDEQIIARYMSNTDRYPKYVKQVDEALKDSTITVALVGYYDKNTNYPSNFYFSDNNVFFISENPSLLFLKERGFNIKEFKVL